ncbi:MAG TPA: DUF711 family protein [Steroidobacteraceae bacterium]|nr:DUF711 family protein [Steroidobacteraceae bacterium]
MWRVMLCGLLAGLAVVCSGGAAAVGAGAGAGPASGTPPVRAITVFVELDAARYEAQFTQAAARLHVAQAVFEQGGFSVQTLRITTQPFMEFVGALDRTRALALLGRLEELGKTNNVLVDIGPAALDDHPDPEALEILAAVHGRGSPLNASMSIAGADGIHWHTVRAAAHHVWQVAATSPRSQGTYSFAATAMLSQGSPFFPGSWHQGNGGRFSVGLQSASVVTEVFARTHGDAPRAISELAAALGGYAQRVGQLARQVEGRTGWKYWGFDSTPAPMKDDSIGVAIETFEPALLGSPGSLTAAYVITEAQRRIGGARVGYAGLMLPVLEDMRIAQRWSEGAIGIDTLLAYSAVCATGLDTVPLPGDITEAQLARIIGDVAALAYKWHKPLTARLQPVHGRGAGQMSAFDDPFLVNAKLQPLH